MNYSVEKNIKQFHETSGSCVEQSTVQPEVQTCNFIKEAKTHGH